MASNIKGIKIEIEFQSCVVSNGFKTLRLSVVKNRYGEDNKTIEYIWDITSGTYTLIGYKSDDDNGEESSSPVNLKARQSSRKLQNQVSREGVEAF